MKRPPPLSREEFARRARALRERGQPLTLENVDPAFVAWHVRAMRRQRVKGLVLLVGAVVLVAMVLLVLARRVNS